MYSTLTSPKQRSFTAPAAVALILLCCLELRAAVISQTVSFTGKDVPLKTVLASVKKQTGYGFFYENGEEATLRDAGKVTLDMKNVPVDVFLRTCLKDQPLDFSIEGKTIFIKKKADHKTTEVEINPGDPIKIIKGRVTNNKGEPLVNANVVDMRTRRGAVTDANGQFVLHDVSNSDMITISFIGYETNTLPVREKTSLNVVMNAATNNLDKVVVQAYGTTTQRLATGNIGTVRAEDIEKHPVMNVLDALQGQVAGAVVANTSGYASGPIKVEIRGRNSISPYFPADPLYIIDGVPLTILDIQGNDSYKNGSEGVTQSGIASPAAGQSPLFSLNPDDIESVEVLKDADATAIYGSRAANGVILITTKKGHAGKAVLNLKVNVGESKTPRYYDMMNTAQYVAMRKEALANDGLPEDINNAPDLVAWDTTQYTNWQKYMWGGMGNVADLETSLSGGDNVTKFRIASGYHSQRDILDKSGSNQRGNVSFDLDHSSANQRVNIDLTGTYSYAALSSIEVPGSITLPPNAPAVYDKLGNLNYNGYQPLNSLYPFGSLVNPYHSRTAFLNSRLSLRYEIAKGLTFSSSFGYNNILSTSDQKTTIASQDPTLNPTGIYAIGTTLVSNIIAEPQLNYNTFILKGKLSLLAGGSYQKNTTSGNNLFGSGYNNDALLNAIQDAGTIVGINNSAEYKYIAGFGRATYNLENKYILNLNWRRDGSSRFGPGHQFGNFYSVGGAWIFSEEGWIKKTLPVLSFGKIRASYGTTGSDPTFDDQYLSRWVYNSRSYNNTLAITPVNHTDSTLHWQVNKKMEVAIDIGLFHDKLGINISHYINRCNDQLIPFPTPFFTGFGSVASNSPADVQNSGWEFTSHLNIVNQSSFTWNIRYNMGINRNKLLSYPNIAQAPFPNLIIGKSLNIQKMLHYTGVNPQTGLYTFQDLNHDGQVDVNYTYGTTDDRYPLDLSVKFDGGLGSDFTYKGWGLSLFFYFVKKISRNMQSGLDAPGDISNQTANIVGKEWKKPGDIVQVAAFTTTASDPSYFYHQNVSDAVFTDGSYIRLNNLQLSYSISKSALKRIGFQSTRIFVQGENLFTITKYDGLDPAVPLTGVLPTSRIITMGLSVNL